MNELQHGAEKNYILAGKAVLIAHSLRTDKHFTYKVKATDNTKTAFYVSVNSGETYSYIGILKKGELYWGFFSTKGSKVGKDSPSFKGFEFIIDRYVNSNKPHPEFRLSHSGRCACCGRELTEPESLKIGLGPICRNCLS